MHVRARRGAQVVALDCAYHFADKEAFLRDAAALLRPVRTAAAAPPGPRAPVIPQSG
jgi:hypothetical protein